MRLFSAVELRSAQERAVAEISIPSPLGRGQGEGKERSSKTRATLICEWPGSHHHDPRSTNPSPLPKGEGGSAAVAGNGEAPDKWGVAPLSKRSPLGRELADRNPRFASPISVGTRSTASLISTSTGREMSGTEWNPSLPGSGGGQSEGKGRSRPAEPASVRAKAPSCQY